MIIRCPNCLNFYKCNCYHRSRLSSNKQPCKTVSLKRDKWAPINILLGYKVKNVSLFVSQEQVGLRTDCTGGAKGRVLVQIVQFTVTLKEAVAQGWFTKRTLQSLSAAEVSFQLDHVHRLHARRMDLKCGADKPWIPKSCSLFSKPI